MAISSALATIGGSRRSPIRSGHLHNHRRAPVARRIGDRLEASMGSIGFDVDKALEKGKALFENAGPALEAAIEIIEDPYLPEVACHVSRLARIERGEAPGAACPSTISPTSAINRGIGLNFAVRPLRAVVWARLHPVLASAIGVSVIGALIGIGVVIGKGKTT